MPWTRTTGGPSPVTHTLTGVPWTAICSSGRLRTAGDSTALGRRSTLVATQSRRPGEGMETRPTETRGPATRAATMAHQFHDATAQRRSGAAAISHRDGAWRERSWD